jgi:hypothetical protein
VTVRELIEYLSKLPPETRVWYADDFDGSLNCEVEEWHLSCQDGKLVIGYY